MKQQTIVLKSSEAISRLFQVCLEKARFKDERARWHSLNFEYVTIKPPGKSN